jgi:SAM-dependent methyltransferase
MQPPPISQAEIAAKIGPHLDELLQLWQAEQGDCKPRDLDLIASALPFARDQALSVLDLCCGPGDVGRAIHRQYPNARIDCVDRDPFLTSICAGVNRQGQVPGKVIVADLEDDAWTDDLARQYDVVATVNALHWFDVPRAGRLMRTIHALLPSGGVCVFAEPAVPETPFATGVAGWAARQPPRYTREAWERFWSRANALLGYDHPSLWGPRDESRIDEGLSTAGWIRLLQGAGFTMTDVLLRDADQAIIAAVKA